MPRLTNTLIKAAEIRDKPYYLWDEQIKGFGIRIYAAQIATYMAYMEEVIPNISSNPALFSAINKDTAEIYHELVPFDGELAQRMSDRAVNLIRACQSNETMPRVAREPSWHECKLCAWKKRCWDEDI